MSYCSRKGKSTQHPIGTCEKDIGACLIGDRLPKWRCLSRNTERDTLNCVHWASLLAQTVENLPAMPETQLQSLFLVQEDPLEKGMETHTSILAWRTPWTEEPGGLQAMGLQRDGRD